jgi:hypothetical protein
MATHSWLVSAHDQRYRGRGMRQQISHQDRLLGYDAVELAMMLFGIGLLTLLAMIF